MINSNKKLINDDDTTHQSNSFIHHLDSDFNIINNNDYINQYNQVNHNSNKRKYKYKKQTHS